MTSMSGTIGIEFIPSIRNGVYVITNQKDVPGNLVFNFLNSLAKRGLFDGLMSRGWQQSDVHFIDASRRKRFVDYAERQGFKVERV
jgi:predicted methyltransferase MtxX (methanogen marker protein 4)